MPIFGITFPSKKPPSRKSNINNNEIIEELFTENHVISFKLGEQDCIFDNGEWIPENGSNGTLHRNSQKLRNRLQELHEENNMLKLKYELMLNMLTQTTSENHLQQREIEKLKRASRKRHT